MAIPTKRFIIGGIDYSVLKSFVFSDVFDKLKFDDNDNLYIVIGADDVGLAKDSTVSVVSTTVSDILSKLNSGVAVIYNRSVSNLASGVSIAASSSSSYVVNMGSSKNIGLSVRVTYDSTASLGSKLNVYLSPDGTNYDTEPWYSETLPFYAGGTIQKTISLLSIPFQYIKIEVSNLDSSAALTLTLSVSTY